MLACDGTHIRISMQNMKLDKPVTAPDSKDTILKPIHKRKDHLVTHPKDQRFHLKYLSKKYLKKLKSHKILWNDLESERTAGLLQHVNNQCPSPVYKILLLFTQQVQHQDVIQSIAHILYMSGDAAFSSVLPFDGHDLLLSICNDTMTGIFNQKKLAEMKTYSIEFSQLITLSEHHNCTALVVNFARCLVGKIIDVHLNNRLKPTIRQVPNSYNPSTGTVYYFTQSGEQLREMPKYETCEGDK